VEHAGVWPGSTIQTLYSNTVPSYVSAGLGISVTDIFSIMGVDMTNLTVRPFTPDIAFHFSAIFPSLDRTAQSAAFAQTFPELIADQVARVRALFGV